MNYDVFHVVLDYHLVPTKRAAVYFQSVRITMENGYQIMGGSNGMPRKKLWSRHGVKGVIFFTPFFL
jgi:uncharacterized protein related to proFAR isomerase